MKEQFEHEAQSVYQTSPAAQPKQKRGLVAVLLVLVILFGGLTSLLGILNIRLLTVLSFQDREEPPISFSVSDVAAQASEETRSADGEGVISIPSLGITTETVTDFLRSYYDLPQGVYITAVEESSIAQKAGCLPGDVIVACKETPVFDNVDLDTLVATCQPGDTLTLTIYRAETDRTVQITLE